MTALRTLIENAAVARLSTIAYMVNKTVVPYNGPLAPTGDDDELVRHMTAGGPAMLFNAGGEGSYSDHVVARQKRADLLIECGLIIISENDRDPLSRTQGDTFDTDPGIYQMIEDVRGKLFTVDLDVAGAGGLVPLSEAPLFHMENRSAWLLTYMIEADAIAPDPDVGVAVYATMGNDLNNADDGTADPVIVGDRTLSL